MSVHITLLDVVFLRHDEFKQVSYRRRDDVRGTLVELAGLVLGESTERLGDVTGNGRFFCNDEGFAHAIVRASTRAAGVKATGVFAGAVVLVDAPDGNRSLVVTLE